MKRILNIIKYFMLSAILSCVLAVVFSKVILTEYEEQIQQNETKALKDSCTAYRVTALKKMQGTTSQKNIYKPIIDVSEDDDEDESEIEEIEVYCIEPGTALPFAASDDYDTKEEIEALIKATKRTSSVKCGCAANTANYGKKSDTYLVCKDEHYTESDYYNSNVYKYASYAPDKDEKVKAESKYLYDVAFIVSYLPYGDISGEHYSTAKQQAIWMSPISQKNSSIKENTMSRDQGKNLVKMAKYYKAFYSEVVKNLKDGKLGMNPELVSNIDDVVLDVDKTENLAKLGPFTIDYVDGFIRDGAYAFSGISDMYLLDAEGNKIELENLIVNGKVYKVFDRDDKKREEYTFFSNWNRETLTTEEKYNDNYIDYLAFNKAYPLADEAVYPNKKLPEFYVEFECPNEIIGALKLHIKFSYLKCEMKICLREGQQYWVDNDCKHSNYHCHGHWGKKTGCKCGSYINDKGELVERCGGGHYKGKCSSENCCKDCSGKKAVLGTDTSPQDSLYVVSSDRYFVTEDFEIEVPTVPMKIGGYVFEDKPATKETLADGVYGTKDLELQNIEVALYEVNGNRIKLATLATLKQENSLATKDEINDKDDYTRRTNPTFTDEDGYYEFRGVDPMKKYIVKFTYNGQIYMPTEYLEGAKASDIAEMVEEGKYSSVTSNKVWDRTSKATELQRDRKSYDNTFASIGSAPANYITDNSLGIGKYLTKYGKKYYNETFTIYELSGISLNSDGDYEYNPSEQLIDSYFAVKDGKVKETNKLKEGIINTEIKDYIRKNREYPDDITDVYEDIAGKNGEIWRKLQYIEDCKISAYTKNQEAESYKKFDQFPVYDQFTTNVTKGNEYPDNSYSDGTYDKNVSTYSNHTLLKNGIANGDIDDDRYDNWLEILADKHSYGDDISEEDLEELIEKSREEENVVYYGIFAEKKGSITYKNVYPGQLSINLGLWKRQKSDIALQKNIYKSTIKINGKTETYDYASREDDEYWDIQTRILSDYYRQDPETRNLFLADYNYTGKDQLEVYVTYQIAISNESQNLLAEIDQIVDYYDETLTYIPKYSWAMYGSINIKPDEYYDIITGNTKVGKGKLKNISASSEDNLNPEHASWDIDGYKTLYIEGFEDYQLGVGEKVYLYLTFKVNEDSSGKVNISENKHNIAEINGYSTYYTDGTELPNGIEKDSDDSAGIVDWNSTPGNLEDSDVWDEEYGYEHNFENDTDHANSLRIIVDPTGERKISGVVWEDEREVTAEGTEAIIGNGIRENNETKVSGIIVQMWEIIEDDDGNIIQQVATNQVTGGALTTTTDANGAYEFENFIPGDYIIRFVYGGTTNGYSGQDYKSTSYQVGITQSDADKTDISIDGTSYYGYNGTEAIQNRTDENGYYSLIRKYNYGYDIKKADEATQNYSDAKDVWITRERTNTLCSNSYNGVTNELATTLSENKKANLDTVMYAETGVIVVEGEYNRTSSTLDEESNNISYVIKNGVRNDYNGIYHIQNVDFGLEERPKAQLEVNKKVTNVKITLADKTVLIDAAQNANNLSWTAKTPYNTYELKEDSIKGIYHDYQKYNQLRNKVVARLNNRSETGLIQVTMDEEIMHGATIEIAYEIKVTNVGEVDYNERQFYYTGKVKDKNTIVKTSADLLIDYVANNLQYKEANNSGWTITNESSLRANKYLTNEVNAVLKEYNTILTTTSLNKQLIPVTESTKGSPNTYDSTKLVLSQTITPENKSDNLTYENVVEIIKISNDVGRRMAYSIQGNQNPTKDIAEIDASRAENVAILPPFGILDICLYAGIGIAVAALIAAGIIGIKKKVLKK